MYSLRDYGKMLAEPIRRQAYLDALKARVQPGCVVLEIGTGPGVYALCAAQLGARKVYAVEPSDTIHVARELVAANGWSDRIELIQGRSTDLKLPEPVDIIVSDLRGGLPLFENHLPSIIDARERLLAPGGHLIPEQDSLWACVVTAEGVYRDLTQGWNDWGADLDLGLPLSLVTNTLSKEHLELDQCQVEAQRWAVLDYLTLSEHDCEGHLQWQVSTRGLAHGVLVWFDTILTARAGFSNAPGQPKLVYGQTFFPFPRPIELQPDTRLGVDLRAVRVGADYVWRWTTSIARPSGPTERFEQSTFHGVSLLPPRLRKRASHHVPELTEDGRMIRFVLARIDGERSLEAIARELHTAFSHRFEHWRDALAFVGGQAEVYT